ncbi:MAG TPA: malto-oligosyltrehalose synthase, partial [Tepidisphaeraceae bacterium]
SAQVLESGELKVTFENGAFAVNYYDRRFPISPRSYPRVLAHRIAELESQLDPAGDDWRDYQDLITLADDLLERCETGSLQVEERHANTAALKKGLAKLAARSDTIRRFIEQNVALFNGNTADPTSFDLLDDLLGVQCYRLAYWRVAPDEINYRRFFDINDLAAISMERPEVFRATHELILRWLGQGQLQGLRIDHPDGLYDPKQYLLRLQRAYLLAVAKAEDISLSEEHAAVIAEQIAHDEHTGWPLYVVVEKILAHGEPLPDDWAVHGTSGYDFLDMASALFVRPEREPALTRLYQERVPTVPPFRDLAYQKKRLILDIALASELHMLAHRLDRLAQRDRPSRDFTQTGLRDALREVIACFPVYRSYVSAEGVREDDCKYVNEAIEQAITRNPATEPSIFHFIRDRVLQRPSRFFTEADRAAQLEFAGRFQQLTAPVTAKGIEDTAFYLYNRLISLNEVGGDPDHFGVPPAELHDYLRERQAKWPYALSPLSTHDTKRSEDVRARINVLSEIPQEWASRVANWSRVNAPHKTRLAGNDCGAGFQACTYRIVSLHHNAPSAAPDANDEYLLYQTLVGAWPLGPIDDAGRAAFTERIQAYMEKAIREAKAHTSWTRPNPQYEGAVKDFVARILDPTVAAEFLADFISFQRRVSHWGLLNSLSQTLLRLTAPGAPDTYQGTELWDFSLVDPDNRRTVDYALRRKLLADVQSRFNSDADRATFLSELLDSKDDGRIKLLLTWRVLSLRRQKPGLFTAGEYISAQVTGSRADHIFAFARRHGDDWAIVIVPRFFATLVPDACSTSLGARVWGDTRVTVPGIRRATRLTHLFTAMPIESDPDNAGGQSIRVADALDAFPVGLLTGD